MTADPSPPVSGADAPCVPSTPPLRRSLEVIDALLRAPRTGEIGDDLYLADLLLAFHARANQRRLGPAGHDLEWSVIMACVGVLMRDMPLARQSIDEAFEQLRAIEPRV